MSAPLSPRLAAALDPGIRDVVVYLRRMGFSTCDSGDGVSKPAVGRVFNFPHVFIRTRPGVMVKRSHDVADAVRGWGWRHPRVEAMYSPADGVALIMVSWPREAA